MITAVQWLQPEQNSKPRSIIASNVANLSQIGVNWFRNFGFYGSYKAMFAKSIHFSPGRQQDNEADSIVWLKAIRVKNRQLMIERCVAFNQAHPDRGRERPGRGETLSRASAGSAARCCEGRALTNYLFNAYHDVTLSVCVCDFAHVRKRIYFALTHKQEYCGLAC